MEAQTQQKNCAERSSLLHSLRTSKMTLKGSARGIQILLILLNILVLVLGIIALAIGVWSLSSDYGANEIQALVGSDLYLTSSILVIVGGILVIITALLGMVGAFLERRLILAIYFGVMLFYLVTFILAAIFGFVFRVKLADKLADEMENSLVNEYFKDTAVTEVWDDVQKKLKCCGVKGGLTSTKGWYLWQSSYWFAKEGKAGGNPFNYIYVPGSCCNTNSHTFAQCQKIATAPNEPPQTNLTAVTTANPALYDESCLQKLKDEISSHIVALATIASLTFVVLVLCVVLSLLLVVHIGERVQQVV